MTSGPNHNRHTAPPTGKSVESMQERCIDYLLGELSAEESADFEGHLAASPELNRELLAQSDLLCAMTRSAKTVPLASDNTGTSLARWTVLVATLAAGIVAAVVGFRSLSDPDQSIARLPAANESVESEALLIAQAWADGQRDDSIVLTVSDSRYEFIDEDELDLDTEILAADDDVLPSWMIVALAADAESQSGELGDG